MSISAIRCGMPCGVRDGEEQTKCSFFTRIGAVVLGALAALLGALIVSGVVHLSALGTIGSWSLVGAGALILVVALAVQCVEKKKGAPPLEETKKDTPPPPKNVLERLQNNSWVSNDPEANKQFIRELDKLQYHDVKFTELPEKVQKECYETLKDDQAKMRDFYYLREGSAIEMLEEREIARIFGNDAWLYPKGCYERLSPDLQTKFLSSILKHHEAMPDSFENAHFAFAVRLLQQAERFPTPEERQKEFKRIFDLFQVIKFHLSGFLEVFLNFKAENDVILTKEFPLFYVREIVERNLGASFIWNMFTPDGHAGILKGIVSQLSKKEKEFLKDQFALLSSDQSPELYLAYLDK